jgi:hypothetical protein
VAHETRRLKATLSGLLAAEVLIVPSLRARVTMKLKNSDAFAELF